MSSMVVHLIFGTFCFDAGFSAQKQERLFSTQSGQSDQLGVLGGNGFSPTPFLSGQRLQSRWRLCRLRIWHTPCGLNGVAPKKASRGPGFPRVPQAVPQSEMSAPPAPMRCLAENERYRFLHTPPGWSVVRAALSAQPNPSASGLGGERSGSGMRELSRQGKAMDMELAVSPRQPRQNPASADLAGKGRDNEMSELCPTGRSEGYGVCLDVFHVKHTAIHQFPSPVSVGWGFSACSKGRSGYPGAAASGCRSPPAAGPPVPAAGPLHLPARNLLLQDLHVLQNVHRLPQTADGLLIAALLHEVGEQQQQERAAKSTTR